jgi:hypothetical protein
MGLDNQGILAGLSPEEILARKGLVQINIKPNAKII